MNSSRLSRRGECLWRFPAMARRGTSHFRLNDGRRAVRVARDSGIAPAMIEIVAKDGTTFRVYGDNAPIVQTNRDDAASKKAWDEATAELQARKKKAAAKGRP